jgi:hypothetical protein
MISSAARQLAERIYAEEAAGAATSEEAIGAVERIHRKLAAAVSPILGRAGFGAMVARTLQKAKADHPGLQGLEGLEGLERLERVGGPSDDALSGALLATLKGEEPAVVRSIAVAIHGGFLDLLSTFIGSDLALRLFLSTWPEPVADAIEPAEKP